MTGGQKANDGQMNRRCSENERLKKKYEPMSRLEREATVPELKSQTKSRGCSKHLKSCTTEDADAETRVTQESEAGTKEEEGARLVDWLEAGSLLTEATPHECLGHDAPTPRLVCAGFFRHVSDEGVLRREGSREVLGQKEPDEKRRVKQSKTLRPSPSPGNSSLSGNHSCHLAGTPASRA